MSIVKAGSAETSSEFVFVHVHILIKCVFVCSLDWQLGRRGREEGKTVKNCPTNGTMKCLLLASCRCCPLCQTVPFQVDTTNVAMFTFDNSPWLYCPPSVIRHCFLHLFSVFKLPYENYYLRRRCSSRHPRPTNSWECFCQENKHIRRQYVHSMRSCWSFWNSEMQIGTAFWWV